MPRHGSTLESFLREEGIYEEVHAAAVKSLIAYQLVEEMEKRGLTKTVMAKRMDTSRSQLERLLDPQNTAVSLDTLFSAAKAVGKTLRIELGDAMAIPNRAAVSRPRMAFAKKIAAPKKVPVAKRTTKKAR